MATVNFARREILCKIVYYGPGLCGKTTNLQAIHARIPEGQRGNLTSVATKQDRTLFFDLLPIELGKVKEFAIRLQLYTVPGQVYYNASRKIVLKGVDGVVFVADSQKGKMEENVESLKNLRDNLVENGADPATIPLIFQYNKRDLSPVFTIEELNAGLNPNRLSYCEAVAVTGQGVFNTLKIISGMVVNDIKLRLEASEKAHAAAGAARPVAPPPTPTPAPTPAAAPKVVLAAPPPPLAPPPPPAAQPAVPAVPATAEADSQRKGFWGKVSGIFKRTE
jgi:signal recognition particle receptor subunit beta